MGEGMEGGRAAANPCPITHARGWGAMHQLPSPVRITTRRRNWVPALVRNSTGWRDRFPSPVWISTGRVA